MNRVQIIGLGTGRPDLAGRQQAAIAAADILVGASRHLALFADHPAEKREIAAPISEVIAYIQSVMSDRQVVVLATGDPLFYGIGKALVERLGAECVAIVPNVSVMAEAFARIKASWTDARFVSLHGRDAEDRLIYAIGGGQEKPAPVFLFTDRHHGPARVGEILAARAPGRWRLCVFERLGEKEEQITWLAPQEAVSRSFAEPNAVILWPDATAAAPEPMRLGAPEDRYQHKAGLITKPEIRAVTLSKLDLRPWHVLWDLGAASGSVGIEAGLFLTRGHVAAVEKDPVRAGHIRQNIQTFNAVNVTVHELALPQGMETLPDPQRIFAGGGGRDLPEILTHCAGRLPEGGRIVLNLVVVETLAQTLSNLDTLGFQTEVVQIQVARDAAMAGGRRMAGENPVFVVTGVKGRG